MYVQLNLQLISKRSPKEETLSNFHEFWNDEFQKKNKKTLMFEYYNLINPLEQGAVIF
jgi:hypothetical protein